MGIRSKGLIFESVQPMIVLRYSFLEIIYFKMLKCRFSGGYNIIQSLKYFCGFPQKKICDPE